MEWNVQFVVMEMFGKDCSSRVRRMGGKMQVWAQEKPKSREWEERREPAKMKWKAGLWRSGRIRKAKIKSWKLRQEVSIRELSRTSILSTVNIWESYCILIMKYSVCPYTFLKYVLIFKRDNISLQGDDPLQSFYIFLSPVAAGTKLNHFVE